jgi:hypothetical protein
MEDVEQVFAFLSSSRNNNNNSNNNSKRPSTKTIFDFKTTEQRVLLETAKGKGFLDEESAHLGVSYKINKNKLTVYGDGKARGLFFRELGDFHQREVAGRVAFVPLNEVGGRLLIGKEGESFLQQLNKKHNPAATVSFNRRNVGVDLVVATPDDPLLSTLKQSVANFVEDRHGAVAKNPCSYCGSCASERFSNCGHFFCSACVEQELLMTSKCNKPLCCATCNKPVAMGDLYSTLGRTVIESAAADRIKAYVRTPGHTTDVAFCPNSTCNTLLPRAAGYQICHQCSQHVCPLCGMMENQAHEGRDCAAAAVAASDAPENLSKWFSRAEEFVKNNWPSDNPINLVQRNEGITKGNGAAKLALHQRTAPRRR